MVIAQHGAILVSYIKERQTEYKHKAINKYHSNIYTTGFIKCREQRYF